MKPRAGKITSSIRAFFLAALGLCVCVFAFACARRGPAALPRPQPGYMGWLEKQSMLSQAGGYIAEVSQSERLWLRGAKELRPEILSRAAPTWLEFNAFAPGRGPLFGRVAAGLGDISSLGIRGLYLGQIAENQDLWLEKEKKSSQSGAFASALAFDARAGGEDDFAKLALAAEGMGMELGATLLPPASSLGPDFLLQARNATGHAGLYAMLSVPESVWNLLPAADDEWDCQPLSAAAVATLAEKNILPAHVRRDALAWGNAAGWAATGPVTGKDGRIRRWLYRYEGEASHPVMLWQDPSGQAKKIFSAAVIRQTGLQGMPLAGISLAPLMGLEPALEPGNKEQALSPWLDAMNELTDQIHRYGGWAMQADPVPWAQIALVLAGNTDFCRDALTDVLVAQAILMEDAAPLRSLYSKWLAAGLDAARLARGLQNPGGLDAGVAASFLEEQGAPEKYASIADNGRISMSALQKALAAGKNMKPEEARDILLNFFSDWSLGLPGLAFLPAEDMAALAKTPEREAYIKKLVHVRQAAGISQAAIAGVFGPDASAGILSALPDGGYWLLGSNFSARKSAMRIKLPRACKSAHDAVSGENLSQCFRADGQKFTLELDGYKGRHVIFSCD